MNEPIEKQDDAGLIAHILERYHQRHRQQLSELIVAAKKVEQVHEDHNECPRGLGRFLEGMANDLFQHMAKEENILFPMIVAGQGAMAVGPISVMKQEHDLHATAIDALTKYANNLNVPKDACNTWQALYLGIGEFIADLKEHIELENTILFARQV